MELLKFVGLIVILVTMVSGENLIREEVKQPSLKNIHLLRTNPQQGQLMCARLSKEPYFEVKMLLGKPWRIYYTWNIDLQNQCLDMRFMNATLAMINRMYNDMSEYLMTEPSWDAATLMVRMGRESHEMLLFTDQGPTGSFQGLLNIFRDENISARKWTVPLVQIHLKFMYEGKYLLMANCQVGVMTLAIRKRKLPDHAEISDIVHNLDLGPGLHACQNDKNKNENVP